MRERGEAPKTTEIVVIGGGIIGAMAAYDLAKRGVPVVLCEKGRIAGEQSGRNWGFVRQQGRDRAEIPAIMASLRLWRRLEAELGADVGWHQGGVIDLAETESELAALEAWREVASTYQLDTRLLSSAELAGHIGASGKRWRGGLITPSDGRAEPAKAVPAIIAAARRLGAIILTECAVRSLEVAGSRVSGVVTERGAIAARAVICAAGAWSSLFCGNLGLDLPQLAITVSAARTSPCPAITEGALRSPRIGLRRRQDGGYTIGYRGLAEVEIVPDAFRHLRLFLPNFRSNRGEFKLRLSSAFLRAWVTPRRWRPEEVTPFERTRVLDPAPDHRLLARALELGKEDFPALRDCRILESWAGAIDITPDAVPIIAEAPDLAGFIIATGFSGHGFGIGPAAGTLAAELALGATPGLDIAPFRLDRFSAS